MDEETKLRCQEQRADAHRAIRGRAFYHFLRARSGFPDEPELKRLDIQSLPTFCDLEEQIDEHTESCVYTEAETSAVALAYVELAIAIFRDIGHGSNIRSEMLEREQALALLSHVRKWINEVDVAGHVAELRARAELRTRSAAEPLRAAQ